MKRLIACIIFLTFWMPILAHGQTPYIWSRTSGVKLDTDCAQSKYYGDGVLCYDTDNDVLYVGSGAANAAVGGVSAYTDITALWASGSCTGLLNSDGTCKAIGTNVQAYHAALASIAGLSELANGIPYTTADNTWAILTSSANVISLLQSADYAAMRTNLSLVPGTNVQAYNANLAAIAGLTTADVSIIQWTGAGTASVLTCTANQLIGANSGGTALECKDSLSISTINLPSTDADPGTTAGQIKHDSTDTGSSSGGTAKWYDGAQVRSLVDMGTNYTYVVKSEYLPIGYAEDDDSVTAPAAKAEIGTTGLFARSFAEDADNGVLFFWQIPMDYVSGIKFRVYFATDTNAGADETAVFNLSGCAMASSGALACSEGTGQEAVLELTTDEDTGELLVSGWSAAITIGGSPAAGQMAKLLLIRDITGGSTEDDMVGHALISGIEIKYVGKLNPFSDY